MEQEKGLERTYGRGSGERQYHRIPMTKTRKRFYSALFHPGHAKYPQTGVYASEEQSVLDGTSDFLKDESL